jgi:hypothetical protein
MESGGGAERERSMRNLQVREARVGCAPWARVWVRIVCRCAGQIVGVWRGVRRWEQCWERGNLALQLLSKRRQTLPVPLDVGVGRSVVPAWR